MNIMIIMISMMARERVAGRTTTRTADRVDMSRLRSVLSPLLAFLPCFSLSLTHSPTSTVSAHSLCVSRLSCSLSLSLFAVQRNSCDSACIWPLASLVNVRRALGVLQRALGPCPRFHEEASSQSKSRVAGVAGAHLVAAVAVEDAPAVGKRSGTTRWPNDWHALGGTAAAAAATVAVQCSRRQWKQAK